jgi:hypothetical protein
MATLTVTPTQTFVSGNTVTPATLNQLAQSTVALTAGTIVDADVSPSAAIEGTKIDPNFGAQGVETTGNVTATRLVAANGTDLAPSITFTGDGNTGIFHPLPDTIAFCKDATEVMRITSDGKVGIGTSSPGYLLDVDGIVNTTASFRVNGVFVVGARQTGWTAPTGTATRTTFATASVTLPQLAQRVHALIDDLIAHGLIGP